VGDIADGAASTDMSDAAGAGAQHRRPNLASARVLRLTSPITQQFVFGYLNVHSAAGKIDDIISMRLVAWHIGRTSVCGRRTFAVLRSTCS